MKNKKAVIIIISLFYLFFSCSFLFSNSLQINFSIEPEFGFLDGTITENVWNASMTNKASSVVYEKTTLLSRLDWQIDNTPYIGAQGKIRFNRVILFDFCFRTAFKTKCGMMEDYDWKIISKPDHLTNYSIHNNNIISFNQGNINLGYVFIPNTPEPIHIIPKIGICFFSFDFTGSGGYKTYEFENWEKIFFPNEIVIEYMQKYIAPRISLYCILSAECPFEVTLGTGLSYVNQFDAYDLHEKRHEYFNDSIINSWIIDHEIQLFCTINKHNKIGFRTCINVMLDSIGFTYYSSKTKNKFSKTPTYGSLGGTDHFILTYGLVYCFYL